LLARRLARRRHVRAPFVRDPDEHVERRVLGAHVGLEGTRLGERVAVRTSALDDDAVGPGRDETPETELARLEQAVVDLESGNPPRKATQRGQSLSKEILVVTILGLEVVLADQQSLRPNWPAAHQQRPSRTLITRGLLDGRSRG